MVYVTSTDRENGYRLSRLFLWLHVAFLIFVCVLSKSVNLSIGIATLLLGLLMIYIVNRNIEIISWGEKKLYRLAYSDALTELPNRQAFEKEMKEVISENDAVKFAFVIVDLDNFKGINDTIGHQCGDSVLVEISKRWRKIRKPNEFVFRQGGDEFIIILKGMDDKEALIKRLGEYLYEATFDFIPEYKVLNVNPIIGGCTSFVRDRKLYRNLDWNYDNTAEFHIICKNFEGIGFIQGMNDGEIDREKVAQLLYHLVDGRNKYGIMVSTHILFNDWSYDGNGERNISITTLPFHILNELHNIEDIENVLNPYLLNIKIPDQLKEMGYLIQYLVTNGTTTYAILPPESSDGFYSIVNITSNPKLTNFRWVNRANISRSDEDIQLHPTGIERWNSVNNNTILSDLRFTKAYEEPTRLSEFIGLRNTDKNSTDAELTEIYAIAHEKYQTRTRNGELWQTVHSVIYSADKIEHLWVQENYDKDYIIKNNIPDLPSDASTKTYTLKAINGELQWVE